MSIERFSYVLRTSWAWAGSTIPQAPKERKFIACGRQPQDVPKRPLPFPVPSPNRGDRRARPRLAAVAPPGLDKTSWLILRFGGLFQNA